MSLRDDDRARYQRHLQLEGFGEDGQQALLRARVLIVGLGGLGCPAAQYLAAAGVGHLTLVDGDKVSLSNLQRQILFSETDIGENKAAVAARRLAAMNSSIEIEVIEQALTLDNAEELIAKADLVLDCTDNFHSRYLVNDLCSEAGKPWIYASVLGFEGQLALFRTGESCFRCLFPELAEVADCNQAGVLGAVPGTLGTLQALTAIQYLAGQLETGNNRLTSFNASGLALKQIALGRSPDCKLCAGEATHHDYCDDYRRPGQEDDSALVLPADEFADYLTTAEPLLIDVRSADEHAQGNLGGCNLPLESLSETIQAHLEAEPGRPILLYCKSGMRSRRALEGLLEIGLSNCRSLAGGMDGQAS